MITPSRIKRFVLTRARRALNPAPVARALKTIYRKERFSIVQIGAFVGDSSNDPLVSFIRRYGRSRPDSVIVLVEPVKEYFDQLARTYSGIPSVRLENVAVAEQAGERDFYRLGVDPLAHGQPGWLAQLGSLMPERMGTLWDRYENYPEAKEFYLKHRVVEKVRCVTLMDLMQKHGITDLDLLQIDAEGYDYQIIKSIDFSRVRPPYINYERVLLQESEPECRAFLQGLGYRLVDHEQDTFCSRI